MLTRFLAALFSLILTVIVAIPDVDACGGGRERRQARRSARAQSRQPVQYEPTEETQFEYRQTVPAMSMVQFQPAQNQFVKPAETVGKVQCTNPDCKCGPDCSCAEFALKQFRATQQQQQPAMGAPVHFSPQSTQMYQSQAYETVCDQNGQCYRRPVFSRFRR